MMATNSELCKGPELYYCAQRSVAIVAIAALIRHAVMIWRSSKSNYTSIPCQGTYIVWSNVRVSPLQA